MALDLSPFRRAVAQLAAGLAMSREHPDNEVIRDGVIQRFEYTYELSHKFLRRFLEETEPAPGQLRESSFPALIRLGSERGLLVNGWDVWAEHRKARGTTSHAYDGAKAAEVFARIPAFLDDARALLAALDRRLSAP
ncbi:nucleotidyltransferase substrate binding protein [Lichenibacterium dinghuense]|uniref:nucleotidyltransferase substrate binding protein n=1 Tax=Lichenibacterium dinghuense TaxID=2895977 RepID=UPI001F319D97|nr:nucleotidyltransferase substrate binding protein [Lichenibacterium sp. 6Y81]